ncbi:MAG TPA: LuxR C-terminal-related transcriptional regulator [Candidatus Angelobacter sp.]|nr:LuxR C-terminal-related transcriptional regulator [Candidatus Angelobacter sp.]
MLFGRHDECRQLESVLDDARTGTSRTIVVRGDAGMGKSAILDFLAARADGFDVASCEGVESESDLPFAGLLAICRPLFGFLGVIPETQRTALEAALALTPGLVVDRFTAYAGALSLVAAAADIQPRLVLIDDLQWLDAPSAEALLFVARRLGPDRVAFVATARAGEDDALDLRGFTQIDLDGLDERACLELLRTRYREDVLPDEVAAGLAELTGGVPLALVEIPTLLSPAQLRGDDPLPDPLPVGASIRRAFRRDIEAMPPATREALLLLAAEDRGAIDLVTQALARQGVGPGVLEAAESANLIEIVDGHGVFRHPLLRSAVYDHAPPAARRLAHGLLAEACGPADVTRRTWHLAAAVVEPDEAVAAALEASARASLARAAFGSAARALEHAAKLTPDAEHKARRLVEAAGCFWRTGDARRTRRSLDEAESISRDPVLLADAALVRGRLSYNRGSGSEAYELLRAAAAAVRPVAPEKAAALAMQAAWVCFGTADLGPATDAALLADEITRGSGDALEHASMVVNAEALVLLGRTREARRLLARWKEVVDFEGYAFTLLMSPTTALVYLATEDFRFAGDLLARFHAAARSAPELLPLVLAALTQYEYRVGDWAAAHVHGSEGLHLGDAIGQHASTGFVIANLASVEAGLGRDSARDRARHLDDLVAETGFRSLRTYGHAAVGLLDLGAGRLESAIRELEEVDRMMREFGVGDPSVVQWMPDLIEAYVRAGRRDSAAALLETLSTQAEQTDGNWARASAARCAGMMTDRFDEPFAVALGIQDRMPMPFERARTQLCYGERLRRAGRRVEARAQLRPALQTFERLGAVDWRKRAATELGVSAERLRSPDAAVDYLSPQELQVALLVAEGGTNREVAAALFVTTKTVEFHLRNVYRKLGIRSRTELARVIAARRTQGSRSDSGQRASLA